MAGPRNPVPEHWLRTSDVAQRFHVMPCSVRRWQRCGHLESTIDLAGKHRFDPVQVAAFDPIAHRKPPGPVGRVGDRHGLLTTPEAAALLERSAFYVRNHANAGEIPFTRTASGVRLYNPDDVQAFRTKRERAAASMVSFSDAARRLGFKGPAHVTRLVARGDVRVALDGNGARRIPVTEVERVIREREGKPVRSGKRSSKGG